MPKTYTTVATQTQGAKLPAATWNAQVRDNVNNLIAPAMVRVRRTSDLTSYTSDAAITWSGSEFDTDGMFSSGTTVTIQTAGIYLVNFVGRANGSATITRIVPRIKRGTTVLAEADAGIVSSVAANFSLTVVRKFAAADTITAGVFFAGGSGYVVDGSATEGDSEQTSLTLVWVAASA